MKSYQDINAETIDSWVKDGWEWGKPITHEVYEKALNGEWGVLLTPTKPVPHAWFGEMKGKRILGLACGGGQQIPVFTALGANCTVLDYSEAQLQSELEVAEREGYTVDCVRADMTKRLPFGDETFDLIFHPVSNCYVEEVEPIWRECYRVLKPGGVLLAGLDNGFGFVFDEGGTAIKNKLPFNPLKDEKLFEEGLKRNDGVQFSHTFEEQIGGQLRAGFMLTDVFEDTDGYGVLHEYNIPTFWATRAVKKQEK